jgi:hypothetical protein
VESAPEVWRPEMSVDEWSQELQENGPSRVLQQYLDVESRVEWWRVERSINHSEVDAVDDVRHGTPGKARAAEGEAR